MRIAFYPAQSGKMWDGGTLEKEALGGSETAVIYVARGLAKLGHEVLVFTRGNPGEYDDVVYLPFEKARNILRTLPLDVLVCSRDPLPLVWTHRAPVTVLWHHDLPSGRMPDPTFHAFVSNWQAGIYVQNGLARPERSVLLPNGVDLSLFPPAPTDPWPLGGGNSVHIAWTSNPERGLWHAGEALQLIREEFSDAELHVYGRNGVYGWSSSGEGNFLPDDPTGIVVHDPLPKHELARQLVTSDLWMYPTWWPETYSIAAVEAQAAGVPIVASEYGALQETVKGGLLVPGKAGDTGHVERVAQEALKLLKDGEKRRQLAREGRAFAETQSWDVQVMKWHQTLVEASVNV